MRTQQIQISTIENKTYSDILFDISLQCMECIFLYDNLISCKAFPKGIPNEILDGKFNHNKPFKGDNGIRFEEIEN